MTKDQTATIKPATPLPALARVSDENDPFTVLGAVVPKGAPMRALLQISDEHSRLMAERAELVAALRSLVNPGGNTSRERDARALLARLDSKGAE